MPSQHPPNLPYRKSSEGQVSILLEGRLGLAGMEARATLIAATMTVESTPGAGSSVFLQVPLDTNTLREDMDAVVTTGIG